MAFPLPYKVCQIQINKHVHIWVGLLLGKPGYRSPDWDLAYRVTEARGALMPGSFGGGASGGAAIELPDPMSPISIANVSTSALAADGRLQALKSSVMEANIDFLGGATKLVGK
jgi:hypothetical protein